MGRGQEIARRHAPEKLIYPLEHAYTPAELGFATLKGADAAVAAVLIAAARRSESDLHLALLTVEESGIAEYTGYGPRRGRWSEPELQAGEVDHRSVSLSEWRRLDGSPSLLVELPVEDEELSPPDALGQMDPDEECFHEATGNEGPLSSAAIAAWLSCFGRVTNSSRSSTKPACRSPCPSHRFDPALNRERRGPSIASLGAGARLSGHMVAKWPAHPRYPRRDKTPSEAARMLMMLTRLEDTQRIEALLAKIAACGGYDKQDNDAIIGRFPPCHPRNAPK